MTIYLMGGAVPVWLPVSKTGINRLEPTLLKTSYRGHGARRLRPRLPSTAEWEVRGA